MGLLPLANAQQQEASVEVSPDPFGEDDTISLTFSGIDLSKWGVSDAYLWAWSYNSAGVQQDAPNNGSWDNSNEAHKLEANDGKLSISFKVSEFFNRNDITKIGFLVKAKDGSGDKKTQDFVLEVGTFQLNLENPTSSFSLLENGESLAISASSNKEVLFELYVNDALVNSTSSLSKNYSYSLSLSDYSEIRLKAIDGSDSQSKIFYAASKPNVPVVALPAGLKDGINFDAATPTKATFVLHAPGKEVVHWIGSENNWEISNDYLMNYDPETERFWIEINGLPANSDILYQYMVDYSIAIADPYSHLILDPWNDQYIETETFAGIPDYPEGETTNAVTWFQTDTETYDWNDASFEKPAKEDLVIYELLLRDFDEDHSYKALIDRLDYLENLGINAIELMPVNEFDGNESWGYNPSFHMATDKYYGSPEMLKKLIDEAHQRGMAVIADIVFNHATGQNPYFRLYNDGETSGTPSASNPFLNQSAKHAYSVFYDFNHQYEGTQQYVKRIVQYWIEEFKFDGFRWDLTKGFTQNCSANDEGCTGSYQADRVEVLKKYADYQWEVDNNSYVIFEHLGGNQEETEWANYRLDEGKGIMLWSNLNGPYGEAIMGYHDGGKSDFEWASYKNRGWEEPQNVVYMESHDEERLMFKALEYGNSAGDYSVKSLPTALDRMSLDAAFFFTIPGPKMIWQFGELGYDFSIDYNGRVGNKPIRWDYFEDEDRKDLYEDYSKLIALRNSEPIFDTEDFSIDAGASTGIKTIHLTTTNAGSGEISNIVIVGNFGVTAKTAEVEFQATGTWYDLFNNNRKKNISSQTTSINLAPGEWHIYADEPSDLFPNDNFPDSDGDGVADSTDNCPDTPAGDSVDVNGCSVFSLPTDAFRVESMGLSCPGQENGSINVYSSIPGHTYTVSVSGMDTMELNSDNSYYESFTNLAPGNYDVCFTVTGEPDFERCFSVNISAPEALNATSVVNQDRKQVTLKLDGAERYYISFNESQVVTEESEVILELKSGINKIEVHTELDCQGAYFEEVFVSEEVSFYPNPTQGYLQVYVAGQDEEVQVEIFGSTGNLLNRSMINVPANRVIELDVNNRSTGLYIVHLKGANVDRTFKVIKE
ncbi:hypothetical protein GCM10023115_47290 [Pontixanthobacter gangjinensis]